MLGNRWWSLFAEYSADIVGLKGSFDAFVNLSATCDQRLMQLSGLNITQKQLFFLSFA